MDVVLNCACGCGAEISPVGVNGKPRKFLRGHQTKNRKMKGTPEYWSLRIRKLNTRAGLCECGCGERVTVSLEWVQARSSKGCVYLPRYVHGHMPQVRCGCGCGTLIPAFDDKHQPRSYVPEHAGYAAAGIWKVDWEGRVGDWNDKANLCGCGCGRKLTRTLKQLRENLTDPTYLPGHNQRKACVTELSELEWSVILGSLLGDMSISRSHGTATPNLSFTHSMGQVEYARHKTEVLSRLGWVFREGLETGGYKPGSFGCRGKTSNMPVLEQVWDLTRTSGAKSVTRAWLNRLDDRSLAYWYMDDGSVSWSRHTKRVSSISLHTEGFTRAENELLVRWLEDRGIPGVRPTTTSKGHVYLYFPRESAELLLQRVLPYAHASMAYKFSPVRVHGAFDSSLGGNSG